MTSNERGFWTLRFVLGGMAIASGLDKFTTILADWGRYLSPFARSVIPFEAQTFMYLVGGIEILVGIGIFTRYVRVFAFVLSAWLLAIAINLVLAGYYDIAARDVAIASGAFALAQLSPHPDEHAARRRMAAPARA